MSNPPAGWYPDPTGQPDTIRWWNGKQWTNRTEKEAVTGEPESAAPEPVSEGAAGDDVPASAGTTASPEPAQPQQGWGATASVHEGPSAGGSAWGSGQTGWDTTSPPQQGGWWPNPDESQGTGAPRLTAVAPVSGGETAAASGEVRGDDGLTPFERARATWNAPEIAPAPPEHWTQQPIPDEAVGAPEIASQGDEQAAPNGWTLRLADTPENDVQADAGTADAGDSGWSAAEGEPDEQAGISAAGGWGTEGEKPVEVDGPTAGWGVEPEASAGASAWGAEAVGGQQTGTAGAWGAVSGDSAAAGAGDAADGGGQGWSDVSWTQAPNAARKPRESNAVDGNRREPGRGERGAG